MRAAAVAVAVLAALVCAAARSSSSEASTPAEPAVADGLYDEWTNTAPLWSDPLDDTAGIDFGRLWVRSDAERITLSFEVQPEISLQGGNAITLLVDGDGDASTGRPVQGLGAELEWTFGKRAGTLWRNEGATAIEHADIGLIQAPTVTSTRFEVSFLRKTASGFSIADGPVARLVILDESRGEADRLPDGSRSIDVELSDAAPPPPAPVSLERRNPDDIRILTWNVLFDGLFKRPAPFIRVLRALDPDVICFQELWAHTSQEAADQVSLAIPETPWYAAASNEGHVVSRYPVLLERAIDASGNYWALIDLPDDRYSVDLSVISAHPPCCEKEQERQQELDGIVAWMRELVIPGPASATWSRAADRAPEFDLAAGTPIVIAGDMNLVGGASQVRTLTDGAIADEEGFGPSHPADWDGTPLSDAWPRHAGGWDVFTWRDVRSSFAPGKLDYIVYSDSVLELDKAFILSTETLPEEDLLRYGLHRDDTLEASDHLPVIADFTPVAEPARTEAAE